MASPTLINAWVHLMTDSMRGATEAQEAVRSLAEISRSSAELSRNTAQITKSSAEMSRWMTRFMPAVTNVDKPEEFGEWVEEWWQMMGLVPRSRYLALLEKNERLQARVEEAEAKIRRLRSMVGSSLKPEEETKKVLDMWEGLLQDTVKAQSEWMQKWSSVLEQTQKKESKEAKDPPAPNTEGAKE